MHSRNGEYSQIEQEMNDNGYSYGYGYGYSHSKCVLWVTHDSAVGIVRALGT